MKHLRFLVLSLLLMTGLNTLVYAQSDPPRPTKQSAVNLLQGQVDWYNIRHGLNPMLAKNRMIVLHIFNPELPSAVETMRTANSIRSRYSYTVTVTVIKTEAGKQPSEVEVNDLLRRFQVNHPVVFVSDISAIPYDRSKSEEAFFIYNQMGEQLDAFEGRSATTDIIEYLEDITYAEVSGMGLINADYAPLMAPGKIQTLFLSPTDLVCAEQSNNCYVADPHNNRVVVVSRSGEIQNVFGVKTGGYRDGNYSNAAFSYPEAIALDEEKGVLYISDTQNHRIRSIDLASGEVSTLLGNGERAKGLPGAVQDTLGSLHFPGALMLQDEELYIAMRGDHRIWKMNLSTRRATVVAGSGIKVSLDGVGTEAAFHAPSGLAAADDGSFYVLDGASGKVRLVDEVGEVSTLEIPEDIQLGKGGQGRLLSHRDELYIADPLNHRIIKRDRKGNFSVLSGSVGKGFENGSRKKAKFNAPVAIAPDSKHLLVLDQNNQAIRPVRANNGRTSNTELRSAEMLFWDADAFREAHQIMLDDVVLSNGLNTLFIEMKLPSYLDWYEGGRNEVEMIPSRSNRLVTTTHRNGFIEIECKGEEDNLNLNVAVYLTVRDRRNDRIYFRTAILAVEFTNEASAYATHDISWDAFTEVE